MNKAILIGHLGKDPELKYTQAGKAVANFTMATSEKWKGQDGQQQEDTTWHNIVAWGRQAEVIKEYLHKGSQAYVEGRIVNRSYDDKDGNKKYISEVVVSQVEFLDKRGSQDQQSEQQESAGQADDDLPF